MPSERTPAPKLDDVEVREVGARLRSSGLLLDYGAVSVKVRSDSPAFAQQLKQVYGRFEAVEPDDWADIHVEVRQAGGLRRWLWPQVEFVTDGRRPFEPFPASSPLPMFEWGVNWVIGNRLHDLLLFHAGALERDGRVLLLPAVPGSGKSTLTAALVARGWRLLSDEFGAWSPSESSFRAIVKPVALKNESIDVIRSFAPDARLGPAFEKTRKGTVAHLVVNDAAVAMRSLPARPGMVVLPRWQSGATLTLERLSADRIFAALAFNAFNYGVLGETGFDSAVLLARSCSGWQLSYSRLEDAVAAIDDLWSEALTGSGHADVRGPLPA